MKALVGLDGTTTDHSGFSTTELLTLANNQQLKENNLDQQVHDSSIHKRTPTMQSGMPSNTQETNPLVFYVKSALEDKKRAMEVIFHNGTLTCIVITHNALLKSLIGECRCPYCPVHCPPTKEVGSSQSTSIRNEVPEFDQPLKPSFGDSRYVHEAHNDPLEDEPDSDSIHSEDIPSEDEVSDWDPHSMLEPYCNCHLEFGTNIDGKVLHFGLDCELKD